MIILNTPDPEDLLKVIYKAIDEEGPYGKIPTWSYDEKGYFHHSPDTANDWAEKAWFRPRTFQDKGLLVFLMDSETSDFTQALYGAIHGRFLAMLLSHFPQLFTIREITTTLFRQEIASHVAAM